MNLDQKVHGLNVRDINQCLGSFETLKTTIYPMFSRGSV